MGKLLILLGIFIVLIGIIIEYAPNIPLGKLPGDIRIERENVNVYIPITSSIIVSLLLTIGFYLWNRLKQ